MKLGKSSLKSFMLLHMLKLLVADGTKSSNIMPAVHPGWCTCSVLVTLLSVNPLLLQLKYPPITCNTYVVGVKGATLVGATTKRQGNYSSCANSNNTSLISKANQGALFLMQQ